jgi:O-antigen/teichoic acid export membrane protein
MQTLLGTALSSLYPGLSRSGTGDDREFTATTRRALVGIVVLGDAAAVTLTLFRYDLVTLLFGEAYRPSAGVLALIAWFTVLFAVYSLIGTTLAARDRQELLARLSTVYAVLSLPLLWLGAGGGAERLAAATLLAGVANLTYHWYFFQRSLPEPFTARETTLLAGVSIAGAAVAWLTPADLSISLRLVALGAIELLMLGTVLANSPLRLRPLRTDPDAASLRGG